MGRQPWYQISRHLHLRLLGTMCNDVVQFAVIRATLDDRTNKATDTLVRVYMHVYVRVFVCVHVHVRVRCVSCSMLSCELLLALFLIFVRPAVCILHLHARRQADLAEVRKLKQA